MFKLPVDFPSGGSSNVPGILMKQAEQTRGMPLAGLAGKVTPGFYMLGLSNLDADKERNLQLLKERGWFDIPVVYNNNCRVILAMEKARPASACSPMRSRPGGSNPYRTRNIALPLKGP